MMSERTLIDDLLEDQGRLSAVERFAQKHDRGSVPAQERYYRDLIPLTKPQPGQQYTFAVDLDACTGCKACVSACHSLNGLDENETWRDVGVVFGGTEIEPYQQTITTACHHCVDPACLSGCPVKAYEKDSDTGIVRHLDDQCIGCQYCVLKCPYDVPKYSKKRGIVRKCDMCHSRLAVGEAPACVQACPTQAISIRLVDKEEVSRSIKPDSRLIPGAFESEYTKPTTTYSTKRHSPLNARPADYTALRLEHAHWPLIWMLLLTQVAAGVFVSAAALLAGQADVFLSYFKPLSITGFVLLNLGLAVSVLHLGRPLGAWRAFLGLRTSWMSREIFAFSAFAGAAGGLVACSVIPQLAGFSKLAAMSAAGLGLLGIYCSAMIYVDTRRVFWKGSLTFTKFFGTTLLLGTAATACVLGWSGAAAETVRLFAIAATVVRTFLFVWESTNLFLGLSNPDHVNRRSVMNIWSLMKPLAIARGVLFIISTTFGVMAILGHGHVAAMWATISFASTFSSQIIERYFFFTAVVAPKMPGGFAS